MSGQTDGRAAGKALAELILTIASEIHEVLFWSPYTGTRSGGAMVCPRPPSDVG